MLEEENGHLLLACWDRKDSFFYDHHRHGPTLRRKTWILVMVGNDDSEDILAPTILQNVVVVR